MTDAAAPFETSYVPAPGHLEEVQAEAKFLVTSTAIGCFTKRNKMRMLPRFGQIMIKPMSLSNLDDALFLNFTSDIQRTMKFQLSLILLYFLLFYLGIVFMPVSDDLGWWALLLPVAVAFFVGNFLFIANQRSFEGAIETRVNEWRPLFYEHGFAVEYVIDRPHFLAHTETYVHIHQHVVDHRYEQSVNNEEAKYLVFFPAILGRRDKTSRRLEPTNVKPPALRNLDDSVFYGLIRDLVAATTLSPPPPIACFVLFIALVYLFDIGLVFAVLAGIDLCARSYTGVYAYAFGVTAKVEKWKPRLAEHGFTISYHVDQPTCWSLREDYVHIQRLGGALQSDAA